MKKNIVILLVIIIVAAGVISYFALNKKTEDILTTDTVVDYEKQRMLERQAVETYVRDNINELAGEALLGGRWYVLETKVDTENDVGDVKYEDGHVQRENHFSYTFNPTDSSVVIENFNFGK
ncbi:MAG: hypothetical protein KBC12_03250 [Candidatus Pacebacteria bacterium]|nr:hypothetical protein [Candidatus Paceibacterota bacterium]MBP9851285.1 hypothetical protein [Candidatus Paceibacterota bacterium]